MVGEIESSLLDSDLKISEPEEPRGERRKSGVSNGCLRKGKMPQMRKRGKRVMWIPKTAVLHSIKQYLKAEEVGDSIDSELAIFVTNLLTTGVVDHKLH